MHDFKIRYINNHLDQHNDVVYGICPIHQYLADAKKEKNITRGWISRHVTPIAGNIAKTQARKKIKKPSPQKLSRSPACLPVHLPGKKGKALPRFRSRAR